MNHKGCAFLTDASRVVYGDEVKSKTYLEQSLYALHCSKYGGGERETSEMDEFSLYCFSKALEDPFKVLLLSRKAVSIPGTRRKLAMDLEDLWNAKTVAFSTAHGVWVSLLATHDVEKEGLDRDGRGNLGPMIPA